MSKSEINERLYKLARMMDEESLKFPDTHLADIMDQFSMELDELHDEIADD